MNKTKIAFTCCLLLLILLCSFLPWPVYSSNGQPRRVLLISSYHPGFPTFFRQIQGVQSVFTQNNIHLDVEFMDSKRFADRENAQYFLQQLSYKVGRIEPYDAVMTADDNALLFILNHKELLFPNLPVVFFGVNNISKAQAQNSRPDITGVVEAVSMRETIEMMTGLQPQAGNIVALVDTTPSGQGDLASFREAGSYFPDLTFTSLSLAEYSFSDFAAELGTFGDESAVLLLSAYVDRNGKRLSFQDSLDLILNNLSQPLFHLWYHGLGDGILGGKVISHEQQGKTAAQIVMRILEGEPVGQIEVVDESPNKNILDYRVMQKFGLTQQQYPGDTLVLHKPVSFYSQYTVRIWLVGSFLLLQTIIIFFLINTVRIKKQAESALRDSERRYFSLFADNHCVMLLVDPATGMIVDANPAACRYYGYPLTTIVGMKTADINLLSEENILAEMEKARCEQRSYFIFQHRLAGGQVRDVEVYTGPISLHGRQLLYSIIHDITERMQLEKQLRQAQKMEAIGSLAAGIAHDFNNILSAIMGYAELALNRTSADSPLQRHLDQIMISGKRAADLVQQILTYCRKKKHDLQPVVPHLIIKEVLRMLHSSLPATIEIREEVDKECGKILADPTSLHQIVMNLCTNALHAMEEQKGRMTVRLYHQEIELEEASVSGPAATGSYVVLSVGDTGCGMDQATIDRIFDPFFTTKGIGKGSGMGLAVIQGIVADLKGFIRVESTPGKGSVFSVHFPTLPEKTASPAGLTTDGSGVEPSSFQGSERILLVDDEPQLVEIHTGLLEQNGYSVTGTTDSREALKIFQDHPEQFDLLLTDLAMPGLSGDELSRAVLAKRPDMPIILCTGHSDIVSVKDALAMGIKQYMTKPINQDALLASVRAALDEEKAEQER